MSELLVETKIKDKVLLLKLSGEIGLAEEYKFRGALQKAVDQESTDLIIDLSKVTLLSSYGIAAIVSVWKQQSGKSRKTCIICPLNHIYDCLTIAGTDKIIPLLGTEKEALEHCVAS